MEGQLDQLIRVVDRDGAEPYRAGVLNVWGEAFGPVDDVPGWSNSVWDRHRCRADYRLAIAEEVGLVAGFAWGCTGEVGQYWPDLVTSRLGASATAWVGGHFEFVELAVAPRAQRRGLGGGLHDALVAGAPHDRGLLGTGADPADPAVILYRSRGWQQIGLLDPGTQVMGVRHPGRALGPQRPGPGHADRIDHGGSGSPRQEDRH